MQPISATWKTTISFLLLLAALLLMGYAMQSPDPHAATQDFKQVTIWPLYLVPLEILSVFAFHYYNLRSRLNWYKKASLAVLVMLIAMVCSLFVAWVINPWLVGWLAEKLGNSMTGIQHLLFETQAYYETCFALWIVTLEFALCNLLVLWRFNQHIKRRQA